MRLGLFDLVSLLLFIFFMGGNLFAALPSWLFFTLLLKPDDWHF